MIHKNIIYLVILVICFLPFSEISAGVGKQVQMDSVHQDVYKDDNNDTSSITIEKKDVKSRNSTQGVAGVGLLGNTELKAEHMDTGEKEKIILDFSGSGALNLGLLTNTYIIFYLPSEIAEVITKDNLSFSYDVPLLDLLGFLLRNRGDFNKEDINIDGNQVYVDFTNLLSVGLLSNYFFTLEIELDQLPPTLNDDYVFYGQVTKQIIDLSILTGENVASTTLPAPQIPNAPILHPVYSTDTVVTGTGDPNTNIILTIGSEEYRGNVNSEGNFTIEIPPQEVGTTIDGVIVNESGYESKKVSVTVLKPPEPPTLEQVYSNDTIVKGTGEPNLDVILTIDGDEYSGHIDENGNFTIEIPKQQAGTIISAVTVDKNRKKSLSTKIVVKEATLSFSVPETLRFKTTTINPGHVTIRRDDPNWSIEVKDTRGKGCGWRITASAEQPLTNANRSHSIPNALVFIDEHNRAFSLEEGPVEVFSGMTNNERTTIVQWEENQGPLLQLDLSDVLAEEYRTKITWTLVDAP